MMGSLTWQAWLGISMALILVFFLVRFIVRVIRYRGIDGALYGCRVGERIGMIETRWLKHRINPGKIVVQRLMSQSARVGLAISFLAPDSTGEDPCMVYENVALTLDQARELIENLESVANGGQREES